jgi:hypothetical protein
VVNYNSSNHDGDQYLVYNSFFLVINNSPRPPISCCTIFNCIICFSFSLLYVSFSFFESIILTLMKLTTWSFLLALYLVNCYSWIFLCFCRGCSPIRQKTGIQQWWWLLFCHTSSSHSTYCSRPSPTYPWSCASSEFS